MSIIKTAHTNFEHLKTNPYPGRGIIIGMAPGENCMFQVYWIMGRSANSRNRIFETQSNGFLKTKAFDESKLEDPSLIIYYPVKHIYNAHIVTNGDQTNTIYESLSKNSTFEAALETREFEPDAPNFTPRISGLLDLDDKEYAYKLSILKTLNNDAAFSVRNFFNYRNAIPGTGHMITTYETDGNPIPSFSGEPVPMPLFEGANETLDKYWEALNNENRVSLLVKKINLTDGKSEILVKNKLVPLPRNS